MLTCAHCATLLPIADQDCTPMDFCSSSCEDTALAELHAAHDAIELDRNAKNRAAATAQLHRFSYAPAEHDDVRDGNAFAAYEREAERRAFASDPDFRAYMLREVAR